MGKHDSNNRMESRVTNTAKQYYTTELGSSSSITTYSAKVGLMYISDYGYAVSPENWNRGLANYNNSTNDDNNWMYMGVTEWTISRRSNNTTNAFVVRYTGQVMNAGVNSSTAEYGGVRPSFYLESSVAYAGGTGTASDPILITD